MSTPDPIEIRPVREEERPAACRLIFDPPGPELRAIAGGDTRGRDLAQAMFEAGILPTHGQEILAAFGPRGPMGVLVIENGRSDGETGVELRSVGSVVLRTVPPWRWTRLTWCGLLRSRLDFPLPPDALHVVELHVRPDCRDRGIGGRLLDHALAVARSRGNRRLVLSTLSSNPARRLYERHGFRVTAEKTVPGYRRLTGAPGRVFMERLCSDVA